MTRFRLLIRRLGDGFQVTNEYVYYNDENIIGAINQAVEKENINYSDIQAVESLGK